MFAYMEHSALMTRGVPNPSSREMIAHRLYLTRKALGYTQAFIANLIGLQQSAWNNYEQGHRRIDVDPALRLCQVTGIGMSWIYQGNITDVPTKLAEKIQLELRAEAAAERVASRRS